MISFFQICADQHQQTGECFLCRWTLRSAGSPQIGRLKRQVPDMAPKLSRHMDSGSRNPRLLNLLRKIFRKIYYKNDSLVWERPCAYASLGCQHQAPPNVCSGFSVVSEYIRSTCDIVECRLRCRLRGRTSMCTQAAQRPVT